jgi:polysaccharide biosynthesis/export protein
MGRRSGRAKVAVWMAALCGCTLLANAQQSLAANKTQGANESALAPTVRTASPLAPAKLSPYTVGTGDLLNISVWKEKELSLVVTVRPDGNISMPLIGEYTVVGLRPLEIENLLQERLAAMVVNPRVSVTVVEIHSRMVYITGEVARPGAYSLNGPLDVLQLIAEAGGLTEFASRKKIRIIKTNNSGRGVPFDYNDVLRSGDPSHNISLNPGDTVVVP